MAKVTRHYQRREGSLNKHGLLGFGGLQALICPGEVRLIAPQYVRPYRKRHKTDAADAAAIVEAGTREHMNFVPIKTIEQQDLQSLRRIRQLEVETRTALMNQIRGLLAEYGIAIAKGHAALRKALIECALKEKAKRSCTILVRR